MSESFLLQKFQEYPEIQSKKYFEKTKSEFKELYQDLVINMKTDYSHLEEKLIKNNIVYNRLSPYEQFNFSVQRIVPSLQFYCLHIQLGHFQLMANIALYPSLDISSIIKDGNAQKDNIYFAEFSGKSLCFKTFSFQKQFEFRKLLLRVVKQWVILRICSVLEVSPLLQNYLGFDIISGKNFIQFAMQKGKQIKHLKDYQKKQLSQQLRIIHQFNIIHCDIKPQNIVFSEYFNKPVFIDFGFSQIIKEIIGQKSQTSFKGTPNFCSPEMLILIIDGQSLIDMYYNDAYSLRQTCNYYQLKSLKIEALSQQCEAEYYKLYCATRQAAHPDFILCLLQFYYVTQSELKLKATLKQYISKDAQNIKKFLLFMKKTAKFIFLPNLYYEYLSEYKSLPQYIQIEQNIKFGTEVFYFNKILINQEESMSQKNMIYLSSPFCRNVSEQLRYECFFKIILNTQKIDSIDYIVAMVFECIRFDEKNLQFDEKVKIANKVNPLLILHIQFKQDIIQQQKKIGQSEGLKSVKTLMKLIFKFCLTQKLSKWIIENFFDVFQQLIMLTNYFSFLQSFFAFLKQNQSEFSNILIYLQLLRLMESIFMMKFRKQIYEKSQLLFQQNIQYHLNEFNTSQSSRGSESKHILDIFDFIKKNRESPTKQSILCNQKKINKIKNPKIRNHLFVFVTVKLLKTYLQYNNKIQVLKLVETIKKSKHLYSLDFFSRSNIIISLMRLTHNEAAIQIYYNYISSIINSPQIFGNFDTQRFLEKHEQQHICQNIDLLIQKLPYFGESIYTEIFLVMRNWKNKQLSKDNAFYVKYMSLYNAYKQIKDKIQISLKNSPRAYLDLFKKVLIQFYFYQLSPNTKEIFEIGLKQSVDLEPISEGRLSTFKICSYYLYKYYISLDQQQQKDCLSYLSILINIYKQLKINFMTIEVLKSLNSISQTWKNNNILTYSTQLLFYHCRKENQMTVYLTEPCNYLLQALYSFARYNQVLFYQILLELTEFFSQNSFYATNSYFLNFLTSLDCFLKHYNEKGYLIHFRNFEKHCLSSNPYLLIFYAYSLLNEEAISQERLFKIFAAYSGYLSNFARKKLLEKYFRAFVSFLKSKLQRRKIYVFRVGKNYIGKKYQKKFVSQILKNIKMLSAPEIMKEKIRLYLTLQ